MCALLNVHFFVSIFTHVPLLSLSLIQSHMHTTIHIIVCFPLNPFVFDMHAQSCPAPTLLWEKALEGLAGYKA